MQTKRFEGLDKVWIINQKIALTIFLFKESNTFPRLSGGKSEGESFVQEPILLLIDINLNTFETYKSVFFFNHIFLLILCGI